MAKHDVKFTVPERPLGKADVEFVVKKDGEAFGRLKVSNGSVVWVPRNKKYGSKVGWDKLSEYIINNGTIEK